MQNINFYSRSLRLRHDWLGARTVLALLGAAALIVGLAGAWVHGQAHRLRGPADADALALQDQQATMLDLVQKIAARPADTTLEQRLLAAQRTLDQHQSALRMLRESGSLGSSGYAPALQALARQSIDGLWLTVLTLDRGEMAIRGRSLRPELIPAYLERLRLEPALHGQTFRSLDIRRPDAEREPAAPAPADGARAPAARAPFVEFSLTGSGAVADALPEARP